MGAVASWGRIQVHDDGFRAEHACIVTLAYHPDTPPAEVVMLERVAARYRVELIPIADLQQAASLHGSPLPASLRPSNHDGPATPATNVAGDVAAREEIHTAETPDVASSLDSASPAAPRAREALPRSGSSKAATYALLGLLGVVALAVGLASLWHPVTALIYGEPHFNDIPPTWLGGSLLVVPVVLLGFAAREIWWALDLDLIAWHERRRRERHRP